MYFLVWFCHAAANIGQWFKWNGVNPRNPYAVLERFPISPSSVTTSPKGANTLASISLLQLMGCTNWPVCHQTASLNYTSYHMHSLKVDFRPVDTSGQNIVFRPPIRPCLWEQCRVTLHNLPTYMYVLCLIHIIYTTSRRILTYCWETWWREGLISPEVTCWRTSPLWQSSDIACLSCLSHLLTLYTLALAFSNLCIFSCIYIYIYSYKIKMQMHKNTCTVYVICLQNYITSTIPLNQPPRESGGTHHRITPPTMGSTCFKPSNSSKTSACEASDLDRREDNTNFRTTLNLLMKKWMYHDEHEDPCRNTTKKYI